eukprot:g15535.t1
MLRLFYATLSKLCVRLVLQHLPCRVSALLASRLAARYHFAATQDKHFKLPPYKNELHSTRFYALGCVGSEENWKQAISVVPIASVPASSYPPCNRAVS